MEKNEETGETAVNAMSTAATGEAAEGCDELFEPDVRNCFVSFPKGEIGLLSTNDNEVIPLFLPEDDPSETKQSE